MKRSNKTPKERGSVSTKRKWELIPNRHSAVSEGRHWILHFAGDPPTSEISNKEAKELLDVAFTQAKKLAIVPGKWRIGFNGPELRHEDTIHIHIICPAKNEELPRFIWGMQDIEKKNF